MPRIWFGMDETRRRLIEAVARVGKTLAEVSKAIGRNHSYLQQFVKYGKPKKLPEDERRAVATLLGIDESLLKDEMIHTNSPKMPREALPTPTEFPIVSRWPLDVPVRGIGACGSEGDFAFNGDVIDYVRRPPGLSAARDAFALYVVGTSMSPWKEPGDLIFVRAGRPPSIGDYVVVELKPEHEGEAGVCLIKRLVGRDSLRLKLTQYNPPRDIEIEMSQVATLFRIVPLEELVGV